MTSYIAHHELNVVQRDIDELARSGILVIEAVRAGTPAYKRFKQLKSARGIHKGEAEAIAWAMELPRDERPVFISNDWRARKCAEKHHVPAGDLMDLAVETINGGIVDRARVKERLEVWDDRSKELCRPKDYDGFDSTFQRRSN